ncbi:SDR family NAD(P)-dependent oxidoreductase [Meiothermus ruber]|jgi:NAD(P)-dependent dehydrogenase (short-subunit alcohol dehydrogenase family)|uniref:Short-chain dehydrogenase/reductase SDR n=1 Tax=Meiothermus ruber (strain ATCC 35948 / DSM 1279 / VKM B-1258 / 21) TaxID=504728 RepID=D3PL59_MEIRD|nr:SDR family oxidoreductase [Meiothermus ruber]ADD26955.1 short-chain dehydrogenase/reductase SDR [Meiothermus ruber DSM 1279]AGK03408.1 short-chain dehydrogenase/reductase SDR [Meiothermus ruber DSM 1279]MCL6530794.1 SDR family oxidoreductase [Meiothermus ruber]GAO73871.1 estradiol 17-beta-dehydrogenase [Meiothermus ruber H328]
MKVQGKVVVVTGGGSGMGRALVLRLLSKGARVAAVDLNAASLQETAQLAQAAERLSTHVLNITQREAVEALPAEVMARHGAVDGLINNAGIIQPFVRVNDLDYGAIERVMNVNFYGTLYMTKAFLPHLLQRPEAHIVNISSMGGFLPVPGQSVYGASKAAVKLLSEGLFAELLDTPVRVTVVFPGAVSTNITVNSGVAIRAAEGRQPAARPLEPERAAQIIVEGMEQNRFRVLVGSDARLMDFLYRLSPERAARFIYRQMRSLLGAS